MSTPQEIMKSARKLGESSNEQGFFEIDFMDGQVGWANKFALTKMGYTLNQISSMSIFDIVPKEFHEHARNSMSDRQNGRRYHYEIWPFLSADQEIVWWYVVEEKNASPYIWLKGEYLNKTPRTGPETISMIVTLNTVQSYNDLIGKFEEQEGKIVKLEQDNTNQDSSLKTINGKLERIESIARNAADSAFDTSTQLKELKNNFNESLDNQTAEILRLIMTDSVHDKRLENFNLNVTKSAEQAVAAAIEKITKQSETAGQQVIQKVGEAGDKASRKVTIPLGLLMLIATAIQIGISLWRH